MIATTRCDLHVHSNASNGPAIRALGWIGCPECYSEPEQVYEQAKARGMDLVSITDHDTITGAMELVNRGFPDVIVGEEVTVYFPEDRCKLHILVWGLTPDLHEQIGSMGLRDDVYAMARWLRHHNLAHSVAHPLYSQNGRLSRWHLDRCALLFRAFELLNGAHAGNHRSALERYLAGLTPSVVHRLVNEHDIEPLWPRIWEKARTAGSDDHGLLNIGRTWTAVESPDHTKLSSPGEFLRAVMTGHATVGGVGGHSSLLAHQLSAVAARYVATRIVPNARPRGRYAASKLLQFAGVHIPRPSLPALAWDTLKRKLSPRRQRLGPLVKALQCAFGPVMHEFPALREKLAATSPFDSPMGEHDDMAAFADDLYAAIHRHMASSAGTAKRRKDSADILNHIASYLVLELAQAPYLFSLFHQNKDRHFVERLGHGAPAADSPHYAGPGEDRPMKVLLFTDTYADINGPSRFIQNIADQSRLTGRDFRVFTSTRIPHAAKDNVTNFDPVLAMKMPKYDVLDLTLPPLVRMLRAADQVQPDVIHISTPGPVGLVGLLAAKMLRCPAIGVYHTDFPMYIEKLFEDHALTYMCRRAMRMFYGPFRAIFTRSDDYARSLEASGIPRERLIRLLPGIDLDAFKPGFRDPSIFDSLPGAAGRKGQLGAPAPVRILYCGRVSIEKNLPLLSQVWKAASSRLRDQGLAAELIIVGDGPYRETMQEELGEHNVRFMGFRHDRELSTIYASSDLFVFPSVTDTLGQVVMESQASGLPVLVTDQGGPKEVVQDGVTGLVLRADEPAAWVEAIVSLVRDGEKRCAMGLAAADAMRRRSIGASFEHFWSVHEEVWRGSRTPTAKEPAVAAACP